MDFSSLVLDMKFYKKDAYAEKLIDEYFKRTNDIQGHKLMILYLFYYGLKRLSICISKLERDSSLQYYNILDNIAKSV